MFVVPEEFNQNALNVRALASPAETGRMLLEETARRAGLQSLAEKDVLDFGCGSRFADAIVNLHIPLRSYVGVDTNARMIDFLARNVPDKRLSFHYLNSFNYMYNRDGAPLTENTLLPIGEQQFDIICMFSVITHQSPEDARHIFRMLRRYARPGSALFFTANIRGDIEYYLEEQPNDPCALSAYSIELLGKLLRLGGWQIRSLEPRNVRGLPMMDSVLCVPL